MKHQYSFPLGMLARLLLWSNGEIKHPPEQVLQWCHLLRAKVAAVQAQAEAAARQTTIPLFPNDELSESEAANGDAPPDTETDLPW